jgi:hypothetical protein
MAEILPAMVASLPPVVVRLDMPIKRPVVTEIDLLRARQIVCSLMPLKRLSSDDAEIVARAIAEGIAGGSQTGSGYGEGRSGSVGSARAGWHVVGPYATVRWDNLGPISHLFPFYIAALAAIPAITAAELATYIARRRQKALSGP